jgi:uncharacterized protein (DUF427 family)
MANHGQPPPKAILLPLVARSRNAWGPPPRGLRLEAPGPGQESVWDYPRPPRLEDVPERVRVVFGGEVLAETEHAVRVLETAGAPVYYLPRTSFRDGALIARDIWTVCEWKGVAVYFDVISNGVTAEAAAYGYPEPFDDQVPAFSGLADYISIYPGPMADLSGLPGDGCFVGDERARPQPGGYYGGWVLDRVTGPIKGAPGSESW